ncbi:MAG TPA: SOS response-associated peptidase [Herpetosiphonaceae bacterium]
MCGRYSIFTQPQQLAERFEASLAPELLAPRYNAAPTQLLPVITNHGERRIQLLRWGLVPSWADDPSIGSRMINARAETLEDKPAYRTAFAKRRCLVLADGFYEWQKVGGGKVPVRFKLASGEPFAFAGLWESWDTPEGEPLLSFTIVTGEPNELVAPVHNRMPVILTAETERTWLEDGAGGEAWKAALRPYPAELMESYAVSKLVNSPGNDSPALIERA